MTCRSRPIVLPPAEALLNAFPFALAQRVAQVPSSAFIDCAAAAAFRVPRQMRRHVRVPASLDEPARVVIRKTVPTADVVVMNPTHYAVALKYDVTRAQAPYVVAKGVDEVALFIRDVARGHNVEVIELPSLARAIYHTSQVNQQIPAELYRAVAQVLSYVLQIKAFRRGGRDVSPSLPTGITIPEHLQKSQSR